MKPLSANPEHVRYLCGLLELGAPGDGLTRVYGGFHHKMWRLETDRDRYAVKQLSADVDAASPDAGAHYDVTEAIAETFSSEGIPAIFALKSHNQAYLQLVDKVGYLVYPWTDAVALGKNNIPRTHALKVARLLARMHRADIVAPRLQDAQFDYHPEDKIIALVNRATQCNARDAGVLNEELPGLLRIAQSHREAISLLEKHVVISHGDLDHKNVLWSDSGEPALIDWESVRRLNPTYEIVLEALDWSGITSTFQRGLFEKMLSEYSRVGGAIEVDSLEASFHCILGDWLNWLMYNVGRSVDLEDAEERLVGAGQVDLSLSTILRLQRLFPNLLRAAGL